MKQLMFCQIACSLLLLACRVNSTNSANGVNNGNKMSKGDDTLYYNEVVLRNNFADTCFVFKDEAGDTISLKRNFEIVENTFGDTMNVGINFVKPGQIGKLFNTQVDTLNRALDNSEEYRAFLEERDLPELYTKWLCLYNLNLRHGHPTTRTGQMRIRVYYKPKKPVADKGH
jgi:hypothetical protein